MVDDVLLEADPSVNRDCDCDKVIVLLSSYPNEFMSGKNNSIVVQDALFNFILNSNKNVKKVRITLIFTSFQTKVYLPVKFIL